MASKRPRVCAKLYQKKQKKLDPTKVCLSKVLLDSVSSELSGLEIYKLYFESFTLTEADSNLSCLSGRPSVVKKIISSMYKLKSPDREPAFFSFQSFHDLGRLSALLNRDLVIYSSSSLKTLKTADVFYDCRFLASGGRASRLRLKAPLFFLLTRRRELFKLEGEETLQPNFDFLSHKTVEFRDNWSVTLAELTGLHPAPVEQVNSLPNDLQEHRHSLHQLWQEPVLFVALCQTKLMSLTNKSLLYNPNNCHFVTVALVGPPLAKLAELDIASIKKVVCFLGGRKPNLVCLLKENFKARVLSELIRTLHKDKICNKNLLDLPSVSRQTVGEALQVKLEAKKKKRLYVPKAERLGKKCACEICLQQTYDHNMSSVGPEKLVTYNLDVTELLRLLGLDSTENVKAVEELCRLSVASMDIESTTKPLDLSCPVDPSTGVRHSVVDGFTLEGHLQKIQKPLMIAHLDALMENGEPRVFVIDSDDEEAVYKMMIDYWKFVLSQQLECKRIKAELVKPITTILDAYNLAHVEFHRKCSEPLSEADQDISGSWKNSLPGKLQAALSKLVRNYVVFSFYG